MVGLGRVGANMVRRLLKAGHRCTVFDVSAKAVEELAREGSVGASSFADLVQKLDKGYLHCGPNGAGHFVKMVHLEKPATEKL